MGGYTIPTKLFQSFKIIYVDGLRIKIPLFLKVFEISIWKTGKFLLKIITGKKMKILHQINKCII